MIENYEEILNEWAVGNSPTATILVSNIDDAPQEWSTPIPSEQDKPTDPGAEPEYDDFFD